jgi:hypothetical protein
MNRINHFNHCIKRLTTNADVVSEEVYADRPFFTARNRYSVETSQV